MANKATAKKANKKTAKKPRAEKAAAAAGADDRNIPQRHRLHLHNITSSPAEWRVSAAGLRCDGVIPPMSQGAVHVNHAPSYRVAFWKIDSKGGKSKADPVRIQATGHAIFTGRKIYVTHPH